MSGEFHIIIPARFNSTRFPGKLTEKIGDKTILEHVYTNACKAKPKTISIATDDDRIAFIAEKFNAKVIKTCDSHQSGTDRVAQAALELSLKSDEIIVNVQGDEPFIRKELITQVASMLTRCSHPMATLCWPITSSYELTNPSVVKVVRNKANHALYFSRATIPFERDSSATRYIYRHIGHVFRHIGLYAYRANFLQTYVKLSHCEIEQCEKLEQLRALWHGYTISVDTAHHEPLPDVNTPEDLAKAQLLYHQAATTIPLND
jgi:3-deoxy-manno-octulosonate cytidylyltransferase (CMP-KDO synthetase)